MSEISKNVILTKEQAKRDALADTSGKRAIATIDESGDADRVTLETVNSLTDAEASELGMAGLTIKQRRAVICLADGMGTVETSRVIGVHRNTILFWLQKDEFRKARDSIIYSSFSGLLGRAVRVLDNQLKSPNEWVAQNAARIVIEKVLPVAQQEGSAMVVNFNMPKPAMPPTSQIIDANVTIDENGEYHLTENGGVVGG